jgi:outer membrane protein assembly factor BamD (BamD/ComL family)
MSKKISWILISAAIIMLCGTAAAKTWRLGEDEQWQEVSEDEQGRYLMAVAEVKKLVNSGEPAAAEKALEKLKETLPETIGEEFEAFIEAELLLAKGKFDKAVRSYDKFLDEHPRSQLYESALDRQFQVATAYLAGHKRRILKLFSIRGYSEGVSIMEKIAARTGDAPIAKRAMTSIARSYEKRGRFTEAYETWSEISSRWPGGDLGRQALLGMARSMHAAYRGPKYDASSLISARGYYQEFQMRYKEYAEEIGVEQILEDIEEQIAYKQYTIGEYYDRTGSRLAANLYYQHVTDDWPDSTAAQLVEKATDKEMTQEKEK